MARGRSPALSGLEQFGPVDLPVPNRTYLYPIGCDLDDVQGLPFLSTTVFVTDVQREASTDRVASLGVANLL